MKILAGEWHHASFIRTRKQEQCQVGCVLTGPVWLTFRNTSSCQHFIANCLLYYHNMLCFIAAALLNSRFYMIFYLAKTGYCSPFKNTVPHRSSCCKMLETEENDEEPVLIRWRSDTSVTHGNPQTMRNENMKTSKVLALTVCVWLCVVWSVLCVCVCVKCVWAGC